MSRKGACALFKLLLSGENFTAKALAIDLGWHESNVREWLYEMERQRIVKVVGRAAPVEMKRGARTSVLYSLNQPRSPR